MTVKTVKWYQDMERCGFIQPENGYTIFVHRLALKRPYEVQK
jgi:cold shock CspA family protein